MPTNNNTSMTSSTDNSRKMDLWQVVALAVGTMVGASIFSIFGLGILGSSAVGKAELVIVIIKLSILGLFVVLGVWSIQPELVTPHFTSSALDGSINAIAIFFLSYMGFGLVTNASEQMRNPERNVPRAIYLSIFIVSIVYILVSLVAVGNLSLPDLIKAEDNALAVAAEPFLGQTGFLLVSLGALFSIASALNATLFGGANVAYALARDGELPREFNRKLWFGSSEGLYFTAALGIAFALTFNLNGIASITSGVFMVIYLFVLYAHWKLKDQYGGNALIIAAGFVVVASVFVLLLVYQWHNNRSSFHGTFIVLGGSLLVELIYRSMTRREFVLRELSLLRKGERYLHGELDRELDQFLSSKQQKDN